MTKTRIFYLCLIVCLINCTMIGLAVAEETPEVQPGTRVRATIANKSSRSNHSRQVTGILSEINESSVVIRKSVTDPPLEFLRENVIELEQSIQPSRRGKGAAVGFGVGAGIGVLMGLASGDDKSGLIRFSSGDKAGIFGVFFGVVGTLIGVVAGPGEQWQSVDVAGVTLGFDNPVGNAGRLVIGLRF